MPTPVQTTPAPIIELHQPAATELIPLAFGAHAQSQRHHPPRHQRQSHRPHHHSSPRSNPASLTSHYSGSSALHSHSRSCSLALSAPSRLNRASQPITTGPIAELLGRLTTSLHITRRVTIAVCDRIASPVLIGIVRPMILLPPAAVTGWSPDEIEMVLLHEFAHVRRCDNLINLMQRVVESLLFFHPAVWLTSSWARRERETCCDTVVVTRTNRPQAYAELLVNLAAQLSDRGSLPATYSAMAAGPLRSRIRHILQLEDDPMLVSGKSFAVDARIALSSPHSRCSTCPRSVRRNNLPRKLQTRRRGRRKNLSWPQRRPNQRQPSVAWRSLRRNYCECRPLQTFRSDPGRKLRGSFENSRPPKASYLGGYHDKDGRPDLLKWAYTATESNPIEQRVYSQKVIPTEALQQEMPGTIPMSKLGYTFTVGWNDNRQVVITTTKRATKYSPLD